ncbi:hypothetical protein [Ignatzschineria sp. LJL83]
MKKIYFLVTSLILLLISQLSAQEILCVQHLKKDHSWGGPYSLPFITIKGDSLNEAINKKRYTSNQYYAVTTWPNGGYSVFPIPFGDTVSPYSYQEVKDQKQRQYRIRDAKYVTSCPK